MAKQTSAPKPVTVADFAKDNPGLMVLLALSAMLSLWAATRRAPRPEHIPDAIEPVVEAPAEPAPEPEPAPFVFPPAQPEPEPAAAVQRPADRKNDEPLVPSPNGAWSGGPAIQRPPAR
jgi:hypothetical protein